MEDQTLTHQKIEEKAALDRFKRECKVEALQAAMKLKPSDYNEYNQGISKTFSDYNPLDNAEKIYQ